MSLSLAVFACLVGVTHGRRTGIHLNQSTDQLLSFNPDNACRNVELAQGHCNMFRKVLVVAPEVKGLKRPFLRDKREPYCTTRVKYTNGAQIFDKLRTRTLKGLAGKWDQPLIVPVACPGKPHNIVLEFNFKDAPAGLRFWSKQLSQLKIPINQFESEDGSIHEISGTEDDIQMMVKYKWCPAQSPEEVSECARELGEKEQVMHTGVDCQSSCHHAIRTKGRRAVEQAKHNLARAKQFYQEEQRADDFGDYHDDQGDFHEEQTGDREAERYHDMMEDYWEDREDRAEASKEKVWDRMRNDLNMIPTSLQLCAGLPYIEHIEQTGIKVKKDYSKHQIKRIQKYLNDVNNDINQVVSCLKSRWFAGGFALTRQAKKSGGCPVPLL